MLLQFERGMWVLIHQAYKAVAAKVQADAAGLGEFQSQPHQAPGHWKKRKLLVPCAGDFFKDLPKRPGLLMSNRHRLRGRNDRPFHTAADKVAEILVMNEILDLPATANERKKAGAFNLVE